MAISTREELLTGKQTVHPIIGHPKGGSAAPWSKLNRFPTRWPWARHSIPLKPVPGKPMHEFPATAADNQRYLKLRMAPSDRSFWFNLVIGCSGPDAGAAGDTSGSRLRSRSTAKLEYALADVSRLNDFANGVPVVSPPNIFFARGGRPLPGTFAETIYACEPDARDLERCFEALSSFFEKNLEDDEWDGGQVNLFFAGHGIDTPSGPYLDRGGLVLNDHLLGAADLRKMLTALPGSSDGRWRAVGAFGNCRVDMFLDCCFAGQFAAALLGRTTRDESGLFLGKTWCSSMPFQCAFEDDRLRHGVFSAYFLNEYSTRKAFRLLPTALQPSKPILRDVGTRTGHRQNPWLIDLHEGEVSITIPGAVGTRGTAETVPFDEKMFYDGEAFARWVTEYLHAVHRDNWAT
jgi:hypothetical protein